MVNCEIIVMDPLRHRFIKIKMNQCFFEIISVNHEMSLISTMDHRDKEISQ